MSVPHSFFTNQSFVSLAGASAIVFVVCNTLQSALNFNPRWLALVVAEAVARTADQLVPSRWDFTQRRTSVA